MTKTHKKYLIGGVVLVAAIGYLAYAGIKSGSAYYMQVDAFLADPEYHDQRVRLHGKVSEKDLSVEPENLKASFQLAGKTNKLSVEYNGVIPDLFKAGVEVVVEGRLGTDGVFEADQLLTKCASKYEEMGGPPERKQ